MAHPLLRHPEQVLPVRREVHPLDRRRKLPRVHALARPDVPELDRVVRRARRQQRARWVRRDRPERALVAAVRAETLAVRAEPGADDVVFAHGEDQVPVGVVADLGEGALVAGDEDGAHGWWVGVVGLVSR